MKNKNLRVWLNTELDEYDLIHIEINVNEYERQAVEEWMEENIY